MKIDMLQKLGLEVRDEDVDEMAIDESRLGDS